MSDWHALDDSGLGNRLRIVVHTTVPGGNNNASPTPVPWQAAVAAFVTASRGSTASVIPGLGAEQTDLDVGAVYETVVVVESSGNDTPAQRLAAVQATASAEIAEQGALLAKRLQYWGGEGAGS